VWFEEAMASPILDGDELMAVIPGCRHVQGMPGYSRDVSADPVGWSLDDAMEGLGPG